RPGILSGGADGRVVRSPRRVSRLVDGLMMLKFLAGVHAQTLAVRIWNSVNLQVGADNHSVQRTPNRGDDPDFQRRSRTPAATETTPRARLRANLEPFATKRWRGAWLIRAQPVSLMIAVSPSGAGSCAEPPMYSAFRRHGPVTSKDSVG